MSGRRRSNVSAILLGVGMTAASAGIANVSGSGARSERSSQSAEVVTAVQELLGQLEVAEEPPDRTGYSRERFPHWLDADRDGCDAREEVLIAERRAGEVEDCSVVGGRWYSIYDGMTVTKARDLDIDHVVALAEAWDSGASQWSDERRSRYANDLGYRDALIAVTASSNRQKSDQDPAEWQPSRRAVSCRYATAWTTVKVRWGLTADAAEVPALREMLDRCREAPRSVVQRVR